MTMRLLLKNYSLCARCLNRQFGKKSEKRMRSKVNENACVLCKGIFLRIGEIGKRIIDKLEKTEGIKTFLIGTKILNGTEVVQEKIWEHIILQNAESIKAELNREIGKFIERNSKYKFEPMNPDIKIIYDIKNDNNIFEIAPIFIFGKYKKLKRMIRQTKKVWGKEESVEGLIEPFFLKETNGGKIKFHGAGREDIDALMLGSGRPFIIEIKEPKKRRINLKELQREINKNQEGKIELNNLKFVDKGAIEVIKRARFDKTYSAIVKTKKSMIKEDLKQIKPLVIFQKTPTRVLKRRADLIRKRKIKRIDAKLIDKHHIKLTLTTEAGTYIKEFISGDGSRTKPNISDIIGTEAKCIELNVLRIHSEWYEDFW